MRPLLFVAAAFPLYAALITHGSFALFDVPQSVMISGLLFNNMLEHLLRGDFAVDPDAIRLEAFVKDGRTIAYFGIAPALVRLPLLLIGKLATADITALAIVIATCISAYFLCASALLIKRLNEPGPLAATIFAVLMFSFVFAGPQIQFLKPSVYQEVVCWAMAINSAFVFCAIRGLLLPEGFSPRLLRWMACLAGLALLTRVTTGIGLYAAVGFLSLSIAARAGFLKASTLGKFIVPALILVCFAGLCGLVNYERWGNPLTFADLHLNPNMPASRLAAVENHGEFNPYRLLYGAAYYFFPVIFIGGPDGGFLFQDFRERYYDAVELPASSFLLSDPLLMILAAAGIYGLAKRRRAPAVNVRDASALLAGLFVPILLLLIYFFAAFRYRGDFYAFFELAALLGFFMISRPNAELPVLRKRRIENAVVWSAAIGFLMSYALLIAYKASPFGSPEGFVAEGWIRAYYHSL